MSGFVIIKSENLLKIKPENFLKIISKVVVISLSN